MSANRSTKEVAKPKSIDFSQLSPGTIVCVETDTSKTWIATTKSTRACVDDPNMVIGVAVQTNSRWLEIRTAPAGCKINRIISEGRDFLIRTPGKRILLPLKLSIL